MGKAGEKQKRRPKFSDKKQSERFKEAARELGADEGDPDALARIVDQMARDIGQHDPNANFRKKR
jgi:hypothetical protein